MTIADVAVVGAMGRDLVLLIDQLPDAGAAVPGRRRREMLGGKGANQAVGLAQLGLHPALFSVVGDDQTGHWLRRQAENDGVDVSGVIRRPGGSTALLIDLVEADGTRRLIEDVPPQSWLTVQDAQAMTARVVRSRTVLLQMQEPGEALLVLARAAGAAGARIVLDGAPARAQREELLDLASVLRADQEEASELAGRRLRSVNEVVGVAADLLERHRLELVALEAGADGNVVLWATGHKVFPLHPGPPLDPTGGGDAFTAGLVYALTTGLEAAPAGQLAASASASTVQRLGGRPDLRPLARDLR